MSQFLNLLAVLMLVLPFLFVVLHATWLFAHRLRSGEGKAKPFFDGCAN